MTKNKAKESVTLFAMANAEGEAPPLFDILPRQRVPEGVIASVVCDEDASSPSYNDATVP